MSLFLVSPGLDLSVELYLPAQLEDALTRQWERLKDRSSRDAFCQRLTRQLETLLPDAMDWDIKEPTPAQVSYAMVLSKQLNVAIPPDALRFRGSMHEFLEKHSQLSRDQRVSK